jgi:NAD-dependent dihydropyrimidine dehydrogenase PreA subunit
MNENGLYLPMIEAKRCNGCGVCVEMCPTGTLAVVDGLATLVRPEGCIYCADCETHCPEAAISLPYEIVYDPRPDDRR